MRRRAAAFHERYPVVWQLFERFALDRLALGHQHYGAKAIMERVRWETDKGSGYPALKINDHYTAFYSRRFARFHPEHGDFFRTRVQLSALRPATGLPEWQDPARAG